MEQLEPELVRLPVLSPVASEPELSHLPPGTWDSSDQQVWAEQKGAAGRELTTRSSPESPEEKGELPPCPCSWDPRPSQGSRSEQR